MRLGTDILFALARHVLLPAVFTGLITVFAVMVPPGAELWGGLLLTILLTLVTAVLSLPFGILVAFGRCSRLSSVRIICTAYIQIMQSLPLILVVYVTWILVPVLAGTWSFSDFALGMLGFNICYSAHMAEYVGRGMRTVPKGQMKAARSLGMSEFNIKRSIVLPQALRVAAQPLAGNVIDIFNAAPLVFIIGLTDFLRAGQMVLAIPRYGERTYEVYSFLLLTCFLVGSMIRYTARKLEARSR